MKKDDILTIEKRWMTMKKRYPVDTFMNIPVPVIYSQAVEDAGHVADELGCFMYEEKIILQAMPCRSQYLFHFAAYSPQDENPLQGIMDLYGHARRAGDYHGSYKGPVLIDVTGWKGHYHEEPFATFLAYLSDRQKEGLIPFFYMNCKDYDPETRDLDAAVSAYFRSARIVFESADLYDCMISELTKKGIGIDRRASFYLERYVHKISRSDSFHGTDSIRRICEGLAHKSKTSVGNVAVMDSSLLNDLLPDPGCLLYPGADS